MSMKHERFLTIDSIIGVEAKNARQVRESRIIF